MPIIFLGSIQLGTCRDVVVHHQKMKLFFIAVLLVVDCGKQHATGIDAHHLPRREIGDGDQCFSDQFFRLVVSMDTGKNNPVCACSIIQCELKKLLRLWNGLTCLNLNCSEVTLAESIEIYCILKERLYSYIAEINLAVRSEEAVIVVCLLILMYLSVILTIALECRDYIRYRDKPVISRYKPLVFVSYATCCQRVTEDVRRVLFVAIML